MGSAVVWNCRCGYSNTGPRRCAGCRKPSPSFRRQLRRRRLISAACLAAVAFVSSAKWSPRVGLAAPPPPAPVAASPSESPAAPRQTVDRPSRGTPRSRAGSTSAVDRCEAARQAVENHGDHLPAGVEFRCPGSEFPRWGATSLPPCGACWVEINTGAIGPDEAKLRHVVAHEFCHSNGVVDEQAADDCAARYGFPNIYFRR